MWYTKAFPYYPILRARSDMKRIFLCLCLLVPILLTRCSRNGYCSPNYRTNNTEHADVFLETLRRDGYYNYLDGEIDRRYNTEGVTGIKNITPKSVRDGAPELELFLIWGEDHWDHWFLMTDQKVYRFEQWGEKLIQLCLWDYDGNGIRVLVCYSTHGSGILFLSARVIDLSSMESIDVLRRNVFSEPWFSFSCRNGAVYIDGKVVTYEAGSFRCDAFKTT